MQITTFTKDQYTVTDCKLVRKYGWVYKANWSSNLKCEGADRRHGNTICPQAAAVDACKWSNQFSRAAGRLGDAGQPGQAETTCSHGAIWLCCHFLFSPEMVSGSTKVSTCTKSVARLHFSSSLVTYVFGDRGLLHLMWHLAQWSYDHIEVIATIIIIKANQLLYKIPFFILSMDYPVYEIWLEKNSLSRIFFFQLPVIPYSAQETKAKFNTK